MSYWINTILNNVNVIKSDTGFQITGLRTKLFIKEMKRIFGTIRFSNGMFQNPTSTSFTISKFFLYDFYDIVKAMREHGTRYYRGDIITKLITKLEELDEIQRSFKTFPTKLDRSQLGRFKYAPLPHQEEFFKVYDQKTQQFNLNGYILASIPGSGKTYSSLMLMAMRHKDITLIFSPKNALDEVWRDTLNEIEGTVPWIYPEPMDPKKKYTHYVFNHENTRFALEFLLKFFKDNPRERYGIILDECHKFTEMSAEQTNNLISICKASKSEDIIFMSGTPFKALGVELLPFLMSSDPYFTDKDTEAFKKIFGVSTSVARAILANRIGRLLYKVEKADVIKNDVTTYIVKVKIKNSEKYTLPYIRRDMQKFVYERYEYYKKESPRMIKEYERIIDLFSKSPAALNRPKEFADYKRLALLIRNTKNLRAVKDEMVWTNKYEKNTILPTLSPKDKASFRDVKSVYKYLALKIQGEALGRVLGEARVNCNTEIVQNLDNGFIYSEKGGFNGEPWTADDIFAMSKTKVVMFTDFVEVLKEADAVFKKNKYTPELVFGETNKDLRSIIKRFEDDPNVNPLIATYKSLSTAVPLTVADTCVLLNVPYRDYIYQQTTARVDRLGQEYPIHIYQYQLDTGDVPNISTRSTEIMEWSKKMVEELLGVSTEDTNEEVEEEFVSNFFNTSAISNLISSWMRK